MHTILLLLNLLKIDSFDNWPHCAIVKFFSYVPNKVSGSILLIYIIILWLQFRKILVTLTLCLISEFPKLTNSSLLFEINISFMLFTLSQLKLDKSISVNFKF